jgi:hypothetical protein
MAGTDQTLRYRRLIPASGKSFHLVEPDFPRRDFHRPAVEKGRFRQAIESSHQSAEFPGRRGDRKAYTPRDEKRP